MSGLTDYLVLIMESNLTPQRWLSSVDSAMVFVHSSRNTGAVYNWLLSHRNGLSIHKRYGKFHIQ